MKFFVIPISLGKRLTENEIAVDMPSLCPVENCGYSEDEYALIGKGSGLVLQP